MTEDSSFDEQYFRRRMHEPVFLEREDGNRWQVLFGQPLTGDEMARIMDILERSNEYELRGDTIHTPSERNGKQVPVGMLTTSSTVELLVPVGEDLSPYADKLTELLSPALHKYRGF